MKTETHTTYKIDIGGGQELSLSGVSEDAARLLAAAPYMLDALYVVWSSVLTEYHSKDSYVRSKVEAAMAAASQKWEFLVERSDGGSDA